jgi:uncharacterized protein YkwD
MALAPAAASVLQSAAPVLTPTAVSSRDPIAEPEAHLVGITAAHNAARASRRLSKLTWDGTLARMAIAWSATCALDHNPRHGASGELVGSFAKGSTPDDVVDAWAAAGTASRAQITARDVNRVGCGVADCDGDTLFVTCNYATLPR